MGKLVCRCTTCRILHLSSKLGAARLTAYSASKFAIRGLTQSAGTFIDISRGDTVIYGIYSALELGKHKITVNAYAPARILTPMRTSLPSFIPSVLYCDP